MSTIYTSVKWSKLVKCSYCNRIALPGKWHWLCSECSHLKDIVDKMVLQMKALVA